MNIEIDFFPHFELLKFTFFFPAETVLHNISFQQG